VKTSLKFKLMPIALAAMVLVLPQPVAAQICDWVVGINSSDDYCRWDPCHGEPCSCTDVDDGHWLCCCGSSELSAASSLGVTPVACVNSTGARHAQPLIDGIIVGGGGDEKTPNPRLERTADAAAQPQ